MQTYKFEIEETATRIVDIQAESFDDAYSKVEEQYKNGEIVLDIRDYSALQ
jgi:hypothetical protein